MFLYKPLRWLVVTQSFGERHQTKFYNIHNGIDFRADIGTPCYACFNGVVHWAGYDAGGGNMIRLISGDRINGEYLQVRYMHLKEFKIKSGDSVKMGDTIGYTGNTGSMTTGPHLHFDIRPFEYIINGGIEYIYKNDTGGCIDPAPYIQPKVGYCEWLRVDNRYGREYSYLSEFYMRFKNIWLHKHLISLGRHPNSLTQREMQGLVYGGYGVDDIFNPAMFPIWAMLKKDEYKSGQKPELRLIR